MRVGAYVLISYCLLLLSYCNPCGNITPVPAPSGVENFRMSIFNLYDTPSSNIDSIRMVLYVDFLFAKHNLPSASNCAYACEPADIQTQLEWFVDSIHVFSEPSYSSKEGELSSLINFSFANSLADFNSGIKRDVPMSWGSSNYWFLNQKPENSDSFSFKFYFYKNGQVLDSSEMQPFFIAN
jgi:hypothetical protein